MNRKYPVTPDTEFIIEGNGVKIELLTGEFTTRRQGDQTVPLQSALHRTVTYVIMVEEELK